VAASRVNALSFIVLTAVSTGATRIGFGAVAATATASDQISPCKASVLSIAASAAYDGSSA